MTLSSDEIPNPDAALQTALIQFTYCIGSALEGICSWGLTVGDSYVPFDPDEDECEDEDDDGVDCSQAWVRLMGITPAQVSAENMKGQQCDTMLQADVEVGVLRCMHVKAGGEAPTSTEVLAAALQSVTDMSAVHRAAMGCDAFDFINSVQWAPIGPLGGQYGGIWVFTVELPGDCLVP